VAASSKMAEFIQKVRRHWPVAAVFGASLILVLGGWLWAALALRRVDATQTLILHFNNLVGINQVGDTGDLAVAGVLGIVAVIVNFLISVELEDRDWFLGKLITVATFAFSALLFIGFTAIISVN